MFHIGDKIVYPMHGAGVIEDIEKKEILGKVKDYYILKMPLGDLKISIPLDKIGDMGIRSVVSDDEVNAAKEIISEGKGKMPKNWNRRYKENLEKLRSGDIYEISSVFRDLYILDRDRGLSMMEKKLLNTSKKMLVSEVAIVDDMSPTETEKNLISLINE